MRVGISWWRPTSARSRSASPRPGSLRQRGRGSCRLPRLRGEQPVPVHRHRPGGSRASGHHHNRFPVTSAQLGSLTDSNSVDYAIAVPDGPSATLSLTAAVFPPVLLAHRGSTGRRPAGQPLRSGERASSQEPRRGDLLVLRARYSALEEDGRPGRPAQGPRAPSASGGVRPRCHGAATSGTGTSGSAPS